MHQKLKNMKLGKIMKILKDKRFYKFLIPSAIGAFLFVTPINQGGNLTIPIAVVANKLLDFMGDSALTVIWALITLSGVITVIHKFIGIGILICNSMLMAFLEGYSKSEKSRNHPLKGIVQALQAILMFVGWK